MQAGASVRRLAGALNLFLDPVVYLTLDPTDRSMFTRSKSYLTREPSVVHPLIDGEAG